jgi:hypothetical protein
MPLADYQTLTDKLVRDDTGKIAVPDRDEAIARAVARYSKDRPQIKAEDVAASAGQLLNLPAGWQVDFSAVRFIEYPIGNVPPTLLAQDSLGIYLTPTGEKIMLRDAITAGLLVRVNYTIRHIVSSAPADTIRADDREAVCAWSASLLLDQLAALFSGASDSTIQADNVDHNSKSREYAARAKSLRARYFDEMGIDPKRNLAAGVVVDLDQPDSQGRDRLLHPARFR